MQAGERGTPPFRVIVIDRAAREEIASERTAEPSIGGGAGSTKRASGIYVFFNDFGETHAAKV
jgi:hypothetical protein